MNDPLEIMIADDQERTREFLRRAVERLGHSVVGVAATGTDLIDLCRSRRPDLIITDIKMPGRDGIDAASEICSQSPIPVILVSAFHDPDLIERASQGRALSYLVKPIRETDLPPAIALARQRFREFQTLRQEADDARQALEDRKLIERAKGLLMRRTGLSEPDAFRRLQKLASHKSLKLAEIAKMVITVEQAMQLD